MKDRDDGFRLLVFPVLNTHIDSLSLTQLWSSVGGGFLQVDWTEEVESPGEPVFLVW